MALSRLAFGVRHSFGQAGCAVVSAAGGRSLSTGPQPPDPKSHYFGHWNVSERVIQRPHTRLLKSGHKVKPREVTNKEKQEMYTVPRTRFLLNKRLLEMDEEGENTTDVTRGENKPATVGDAEKGYWTKLRSALGFQSGEEESAVAEVASESAEVQEEEEDDTSALPEFSMYNRNRRNIAPFEVNAKLYAIVKSIYEVDDSAAGSWTSIELTDLQKKFQLMDECGKQFDAVITNSHLNETRTIGDVLEFYKQPPEKMVFYKNLNLDNLPANVKFQMKKEYKLHGGDLHNQTEYAKRKASWATPKRAAGAQA